MATRNAAAAHLLTRQHYAQQVAVKAQMVRDAAKLWRLWTPGSRASWDDMTETAYAIIAARHAVSSAAAARYFETLSAIQTGRRERVVLAERLDPERVAKSLAATGLVGTFTAKARGASMQAAAQVGFTRFAGAASKLALSGGRETVVASSIASTRALGFQRVTSGDACMFCQGIADEGVLDAGEFAAHDHCSCTAEPVFAG